MFLTPLYRLTEPSPDYRPWRCFYPPTNGYSGAGRASGAIRSSQASGANTANGTRGANGTSAAYAAGGTSGTK